MDLTNTEEKLAAPETGADNTGSEQLSTQVNDGRFEVTADDVVVPYIQILNKMSEMEIEAPVGSMIYDKTIILGSPGKEGKPGDTVDVVPIYAHKTWKEDIPYGTEGVMPAMVNTEAAARELAQKSPYPIIATARIGFLIKAPARLEPHNVAAFFPFEIEGEHYALGQVIAQKRGFDATYKRLANTLLATGRPMWENVYRLSGEKTQNNKGTWYIPSLKPAGVETPLAVVEFARKMGGAK